jgi:hypothetical protein
MGRVVASNAIISPLAVRIITEDTESLDFLIASMMRGSLKLLLTCDVTFCAASPRFELSVPLW